MGDLNPVQTLSQLSGIKAKDRQKILRGMPSPYSV